MNIVFAEGCAWRAVYVRLNGVGALELFGRRYDRQIFHLGVDPNHGVKPTCFCKIGTLSFRFTLPWVAYRHNMGRTRMFLYQLFQRFWFSVDGRLYGK